MVEDFEVNGCTIESYWAESSMFSEVSKLCNLKANFKSAVLEIFLYVNITQILFYFFNYQWK